MYSFEILGVSPILSFFDHQQAVSKALADRGVEYVSAYKCTLDEMLRSVEPVPQRRGWDHDQVTNAVINFWLHNAALIKRWQYRLQDAGQENLLVARLSDFRSLRRTFDAILDRHF